VAFFVMAQQGHFNLMRPLIAGLAGAGIESFVFTDRCFEREVVGTGARFMDLFAGRSVDDADDRSDPRPCRYVSFAARYADEAVEDLQSIQPSVVVYDQFAVIGRVVATALGIPYVNVCPAHGVAPSRLDSLLRSLPRVEISDRCERAVQTLRDRYAMPDASPFLYASALSPFLNVYCEPEAYLTGEERQAFAPVAFHGSLPSVEEIEARRTQPGGSSFEPRGGALKLYVSFGTVTWRYWPAETFAAAKAIADSVSEMADAQAVISLGGAQLEDGSVRALTHSNVAVHGYLDQWRALRDAEVFVTHHGINSTHEAVASGVPMISYPIMWDQPALADRCRRLGVAIPLTDSVRGAVAATDVARALGQLDRHRPALDTALARAWGWEQEAIAARGSVLERITDLIAARRPPTQRPA
jgi:UDP:flavonoid glycosyltransferase YjiC (YdhE family)